MSDDVTFGDLLPEDNDMYLTVSIEFLQLNPEDFETAFTLMKKCWYIQDRWNEIAANARKLATMHGVAKTDLYNWAHGRYRLMQQAHEDCRVMWRQGKEDYRRAE